MLKVRKNSCCVSFRFLMNLIVVHQPDNGEHLNGIINSMEDHNFRLSTAWRTVLKRASGFVPTIASWLAQVMLLTRDGFLWNT